MPEFQSLDGQPVLPGDLLRVAGTRQEHVESIFAAGSSDAADYDCSDTGGVVLRLDDGDCWLIRWIDEDYELIRRSNGLQSPGA